MRAVKTIGIIDSSQKEIANVLKKIAEKLFENKVEIVSSESDLMLIRKNSQSGLIEVGESIKVSAKTNSDLLALGTHALLKLYFDKLPLGETAVSYKQEQRILMIDMARKYYSKKTICLFIDCMALAQFNYLQLHFSENEGFRIESDIDSESISSDFLTKEEIREIICYAREYGIEIIPDFDTPGHVKQLLKNKPNWQLQKKLHNGDLERQPSALDITNKDAVAYITRLYKEYADLFKDSHYFHIGGDEFVDFDEIDAFPKLTEAAKEIYGEKATAIDYFIHYVNQIADMISGLGFVPRVWNDGFFRLNRSEICTLSKNVEITYWTKWHKHMAPIDVFAEKKYSIINFNDNYFYYVLGENASYTYPTYSKIMTNWTPFMYPQSQIIEEITSRYFGVAVSIWSDIPEAKTEMMVLKDVSPLLFAVSQKESDSFMSEQEVTQLLQKIIVE